LANEPVAKEPGPPGHTIATVLCDNGSRYQSKLFNSDSMRSKNLPVPDWLAQKTAMQVPYEKA
jgi:cysteine synthase A